MQRYGALGPRLRSAEVRDALELEALLRHRRRELGRHDHLGCGRRLPLVLEQTVVDGSGVLILLGPLPIGPQEFFLGTPWNQRDGRTSGLEILRRELGQMEEASLTPDSPKQRMPHTTACGRRCIWTDRKTFIPAVHGFPHVWILYDAVPEAVRQAQSPNLRCVQA